MNQPIYRFEMHSSHTPNTHTKRIWTMAKYFEYLFPFKDISTLTMPFYGRRKSFSKWNEIHTNGMPMHCTQQPCKWSTHTQNNYEKKKREKATKKAPRNQYQCNRVYFLSKCTAPNRFCCCLLLAAWRHSILHSWTWCSSGENRIHLNESQSSFDKEKTAERAKDIAHSHSVSKMHWTVRCSHTLLLLVLLKMKQWWKKVKEMLCSVHFFLFSHRQIGSKTDILEKI